MKFPPKIWLSQAVLDSMRIEARAHTPNETGGILLGYWSGDPEPVPVVTDAVDAGPNAEHGPDYFIPDHDYQTDQIRLLYTRSGKRLWYLGDWHTHPSEYDIRLSSTDRTTMRTIAVEKEAFAPSPVMIILAGGNNWLPSGWIGGFCKRRWRPPRFDIGYAPIDIFRVR